MRRASFWMKYDYVCDVSLYLVLSLLLWVFPSCYVDVELIHEYPRPCAIPRCMRIGSWLQRVKPTLSQPGSLSRDLSDFTTKSTRHYTSLAPFSTLYASSWAQVSKGDGQTPTKGLELSLGITGLTARDVALNQ